MAVKKKNTAIKNSPKHLLGIQSLSIIEAKEILEEAKEFIKLNRSNSKKLDVLKVNLDDVALNCGSFGYFYNVITSDDFVVPPT